MKRTKATPTARDSAALNVTKKQLRLLIEIAEAEAERLQAAEDAGTIHSFFLRQAGRDLTELCALLTRAESLLG